MEDIRDLIEKNRVSLEYQAEMAKTGFAMALYEQMLKKGMDEESFARATGVPLRRLNKILAGEKKNLTIEEMSDLLFPLGVRLKISSEEIDIPRRWTLEAIRND